MSIGDTQVRGSLTKASTRDPSLPQSSEHSDLKARSIRGGFITVAGQAFKFLLQTLSTIALARLLTPGDYGLVGMVTALTGFVTIFKDLGLSKATVQRRNITDAQVSNLFWINAMVGLGAAALVAVTAPLLVWFFSEPRLLWITVTISLGLALGGLSVQHEALLERQMRFTALTGIQLASMTTSIGTAIIFALLGYGYWALVAMYVIGPGTTTILSWGLTHWRPHRFTRGVGTRPMLVFGGNLTGYNIVNYFARNVDNLLIGKYWGAIQLGLYTKAYQLLLLPINQINAPLATVAVPLLSRLADSPSVYRSVYLNILRQITIITLPGITYLIITSDWIVFHVLGPQWLEASHIFAYLGIVALAQPIGNTVGWLFITQNRTRDMMAWGIVGSTLSVLSIVAGLPWGAVGVALSYSLSGLLIRTPLMLWFVGKSGPIRTVDFYHTILPAALSSAAVALALVAFRLVVRDNSVATVIESLLLSSIVSIAALASFPGGREALKGTKTLIRSLSPPTSTRIPRQ